MAKQYLNDEIANITADTELDGKDLVVETKNFVFPAVNNGNHFFQIKKVDADYAIYPLVLNADNTDYEPAAEPVVLTSGTDIFFYTRRNLAPYMDKQFRQETVEAGAVKEQVLLHAFLAYAQSTFSMGKYNILLTDDVSFSNATVVASFAVIATATTDGAVIKEDGTVSRENQKLVILDNKGNVVASGELGAKSAILTGIAAATLVGAGTYKAAYQDDKGVIGDSVDVPAFTTLSTTTTTTSTTTTTATPTNA